MKGDNKRKEDGSHVHHHNRVGKEHYADIIEITRNVINLILSGDI